MKIRRLLSATLVAASMSAFAAGPAGATNIGNEGCTPGYWKNHTANWEEYSSTDPLDWQFDFPDSLASMRSDSWLTALQYPGGPGVTGAAQILMRASTASFLNAAHEGVGFPLRRFTDPGNMLAQVNSALASGNRATMLSLATYLDSLNNLGCPLN
jgi:hypothetical protein